MKFAHQLLLKIGLDLRLANLTSKPEFKHSVWLGLGQFGVSILAFLLTYVLANHVSGEVLGQYRFVLAFYASVSVFALGGLSTALTRSVAAGQAASYQRAVHIKWQYGLLGTLAFVSCAAYYAYVDAGFILSTALVVAGLSLPALEAYNLYGAYLVGISNFRKVASTLILSRSVVTVVVIGLALYSPSLVPMIAGYFLAQVIVGYVFHRQVVRSITSNEVDDGMVPFAKHMTLMALLSAVSSQLDKLILFFFFGPSALASFWVASVLPQEVGRGISLVVSTFFPRMVQVTGVEATKTVKKLFLLTTLATLVLCLLYFVSAAYIFDLLLPKYTEVVNMSMVLMLAYAVVPHLFVWNIFTAQKMVKELYWYSFAEPTLTIILYVIFIPWFGVWGLVYAMCFKALIMNLVAAVVLGKYL